MNSKRFIRFSLCLTLILLIMVASIQIAIDPLFQYHKPWFGLEPVITDERYQVAGMAKNFDYNNAVIGNSMSENFVVSDVNEVFDGNTVKLTMSGSHAIEWSYLLRILQTKKIDNVLINVTPDTLSADCNSFERELPAFLFDENYINDVEYIYNFSILSQFSVSMVKKNRSGIIPDADRVFMWDDSTVCSKVQAIENYERPHLDYQEPDINSFIQAINDNTKLLLPYIQKMKDTRFTLFVSPFSMLYWDGESRTNSIAKQKAGYLEMCKILTEYDNVSLYMWTDDDMLGIMSDLDNYRDSTHYSAKISKQILDRIKEKNGLITKNNYSREVDKLFEYIESYDYDSLFE